MNVKKLVVYYMPGPRADADRQMTIFKHNLFEAGIKVCKLDIFKLQFETSNVRVRYITKDTDLIGLFPDEIFGNYRNLDEIVALCKFTDHPYPGTMMDYIIEVEKAAEAELEKDHLCNDDHTTEIDPDEMVKFAELVLGLELTDIQKDMMKAYCELRKRSGWKPVKICYGKGGKVFVFPVE